MFAQQGLKLPALNDYIPRAVRRAATIGFVVAAGFLLKGCSPLETKVDQCWKRHSELQTNCYLMRDEMCPACEETVDICTRAADKKAICEDLELKYVQQEVAKYLNL